MDSTEIRIVLIDDHPLFREGLELVLSRRTDMTVVGQASTGEEALDLVPRLNPDLVLLDLMLPGINGIETCRRLKELAPSVRVVMLTIAKDPNSLFEAVKAGACGYLLKDIESNELLHSIEQVYQEGGIVEPMLARRLLDQIARGELERPRATLPERTPELSPREVEILTLVCNGMSNKEIAAHLTISKFTVGNHVNNIFRKLGVNDRTQASVLALRLGLLSVNGG
ncbi:MAG: response regulator transcription factor [Armatimonadetes bacterium]|nr:response regulator transcription factor [Armatimonadota bacterium]